MNVAGFTSTGSKRPEALFGPEYQGLPLRMKRSAGCRIVDSDDREYLDFIMALGAVALGYGHPDVNRAVVDAVDRGAIGPLSPVDEAQLAEELGEIMPWLEQVRFFKTGAEAVAAAVRLARVATGRDRVLGCGYHGWLDWCNQSAGVPAPIQALYGTIAFNDQEHSVSAIRAWGDRLAAVVIEPVVETAPHPEWLQTLREETHRVGAVLVFDEIKTAFRVSLAGAATRWGGDPDLMVLGKGLANGYPLAAVGGSAQLMNRVTQTWISSTMATEFVSFAAARATIRVARAESLPQQLQRTGGTLWEGLQRLAGMFPHRISRVGGIPEMCYLAYSEEAFGSQVAHHAALRGLLFKRNAYNFVSLAHDQKTVSNAIAILGEVLEELR